MNENMKKLTAIENKYGLMLFRMGLTYLVDVGSRNLTDNNIEESIKQIIAKDNEDKENGVIIVMSAEFQCEIIRCVTELSKFSIWTLFKYIKKHMYTLNDYLGGHDMSFKYWGNLLDSEKLRIATQAKETQDKAGCNICYWCGEPLSSGEYEYTSDARNPRKICKGYCRGRRFFDNPQKI